MLRLERARRTRQCDCPLISYRNIVCRLGRAVLTVCVKRANLV